MRLQVVSGQTQLVICWVFNDFGSSNLISSGFSTGVEIDGRVREDGIVWRRIIPPLMQSITNGVKAQILPSVIVLAQPSSRKLLILIAWSIAITVAPIPKQPYASHSKNPHRRIRLRRRLGYRPPLGGS
jgi:hypothetical protein